MRSALREVQADLGPEAVILSTQTEAAGVCVIAALDYDAALLGPSREGPPETAKPASRAAATSRAPSSRVEASTEKDERLEPQHEGALRVHPLAAVLVLAELAPHRRHDRVGVRRVVVDVHPLAPLHARRPGGRGGIGE